MAIVAKKREYRALVNLSVGTVERGPHGREERAERVEKGSTVFLTDQDATNLGRYVRLVAEEVSDRIPNITPRQIVGRGVGKTGAPVPALEGTGALDMKDETKVYLTEAEVDAEAQPHKNPIDPSYEG